MKILSSNRVVVSVFLFILSFSMFTLVSSINIEPDVNISDMERNFLTSSTPINQTGLVDVMMAYDSESDMTIIFGGEDPTDSPVVQGQTWAYDLNSDSYFDMAPAMAPSPRAAGGVAYDSQSDRIVQFGGILSTTTQEASNETWIYDYNSNTWTNASPSIAPSSRLASYMTYDSESDRVILFGGVTLTPSGVHGDTWAYDLETNTWEEMHPSIAPDARYGAANAYDSNEDRVLLFGGNPSATTITNTFNDTWAYDYNSNTWVELSPVSHPTNRYATKMVYDSESNKTVLFGSYPGASVNDKTWVFDYDDNNWTEANPTLHPNGRFRHHIVYDSESDSLIMFGGMTGDWHSEQVINTDTTWSYDVNTDVWTMMSTVPTTPATTTPTTPVEPPEFPMAVVIIGALTLGVIIIVVVLRGVVFPKVEIRQT
jgi:N-acetylneuraminic acid mutarotase